MFWFKTKEIVIDSFTNQAGLATYFPIQRAGKFLPDWWKQLPKQHTYENSGIEYQTSTMKRCIGFVDLYKHSFVVPMYTELKIKFAEGNWKCITSAGLYDDKGYIEVVTSHSREQFGPEFNQYTQLKILMPWVLQEKTGVNFILSGAYWNQTKHWPDAYFASGVLNFKYQNSINISLFTQKQSGMMTFMPNEPLAYLIPMTDKHVTIKTHLISNEEYRKKLSSSTFASKFVDRYKFNKRLIEEQEQKSKCPFGFGK